MTDEFTDLCTQVGFIVLYFIAIGGIFHAMKVVEEWWTRRRRPPRGT